MPDRPTAAREGAHQAATRLISGWETARIVAGKELVDAVRDRRAVLSALVYPLMGPLMILLLFRALIAIAKPDEVAVGVVGGEGAPILVDALRGDGVEIVAMERRDDAAIEAGDVSAVLVIDPDFAAALAGERPARVDFVLDASSQRQFGAVARVRGRLNALVAELSVKRLSAHGIDPTVLVPIEIRDVDVSSDEAKAANVLGFLPLLLVLAAFFGGMQLAVDVTAGERERRSLEPLLLLPVSRAGLALGKWLAATAFALGSVALTWAAFLIALSLAPLSELGLEPNLGVLGAVQMLALAASVAPLSCAVQLWLALGAKTSKEAQVRLSLLLFLPTLPAAAASVGGAQPVGLLSLVPLLGQQQLVGHVLAGRAISLWAVGGATLISALLAIACAFAFARSLDSERVLFGR